MLAVNSPPQEPERRAGDAFELVQIFVAGIVDAVLADPLVDVADRHVAGRGTARAGSSRHT